MRLTLYSDYSLRVLMYLANKNNDELSTIQEIADKYKISKNHLMKVTFNLGKLGYIHTIRGRNGGIYLARKPKDINIGKLIRETEEDFHIVECFDPQNNNCILTSTCKLKHILAEALNAYLSTLEKYTLEDVIVSKLDINNWLN